MFHITIDEILDICANYNTYIKARQYFYSRRVKSLQYDREYNEFTAIVQGTRNYKVKMEFNMADQFADASCTCPAYDGYYNYCKHIGAVLFEILDKDKREEFDNNRDEKFTESILDFFNYRNSHSKEDVSIEIKYEFAPLNGTIGNSSLIGLYIGEKRLYKLKNIKKFVESIEKMEEMYFGKQFTFKPLIHNFKEEDSKIINILKEFYENEKYLKDSFYRYNNRSFFSGDKLNLTDEATKRFFRIMKDKKFNGIIKGKEFNEISILEDKIPIEINLTNEKNDLFLKFDLKDKTFPLVVDGEYFFYDGNIYRIPDKQREYFNPFYWRIMKDKKDRIRIPSKHTEEFVSEVYPHISQIGNVKVDKSFEASIYNPKIKPEIYLDTSESGITSDVKLVYGDIIIVPFNKDKQNNRKNGSILIRDTDIENKIMNIFDKYDFKVMQDKIHLEDENKIFEFVYSGLSELQKLSEVFYSDSFKDMKVKDASSFHGGVKLNTERNLLEFDFEIDGIDRKELKELFNSLKEKKKYYKLKDGSFLPLDTPELDKMQDIMEYMDLSGKDFEKETIQLPKFRALFLDEQIKDTGSHFLQRDLRFKELVQNIKEPGDIDYTLPDNLENVLRNYQHFGFKWLKTLSTYGFGGILADDMGLGKTLQVLAFLLSEKQEKGDKPSLVVVPTSLVYNWASEVEKFTPQLKTLVISGTKDEREEYVDKVEGYDIVITSYPLIRRDSELYEKSLFRYCILDEAQHIKNPMSIGAKAVKAIKADNYFALTGTPIENSLTELWSIYDFVMPGYFLSHNKFKKRFETPIIKNQDKEVLEKLKKHIRPFLLRRLKKDVLKELPEKIETKVVAEMSYEQKKLYLAYLQQIKGEIAQEIKEKGFNKSHIKILAGLTRLRQICCDPSMFIEDFKGESGKLSLLQEIIDDALESNHRILLFSQFTSMLKIIREVLDKKKIEYKYLDGSTPSIERGKMVNEFNDGAGQIFLISLKAGGTGLNLTGADTVIHYDPWWNPAVEEQATDRAHRIGQKNSVQVMKLITKGTIEEKIYELQQRKRQMVDSIIKPGETLVSKLTEEEIKSLFQL